MAVKDTKKTTTAKQPSAFMKPVKISAALAAVVGNGPMPRTQIMQKLWKYIKENKLQNPANKREIKPNPALAAVFGTKSAVNMFEMTKLVSKHIG